MQKFLNTKLGVAVLKIGNTAISLFSGTLASLLIIYSSYALYDSLYTQVNAYATAADLEQYRPVVTQENELITSQTDFSQINTDYRFWLTVYNTHIDYPVVQGPEDLYYASHDIYKDTSLTGAIYLAADNTSDFSDTYNLTYGHHMDNGAMFGDLDGYVEEDFFYNHLSGVVIVNDQVYDFKVFSAIRTDAYDKYIYSVGPYKNIDSLMNYLRRSGIRFDEEIFAGSTKYLAMSTCADATTNGRLVVIGRLDEKEVQPIIDPDPKPGSDEIVIPDPPIPTSPFAPKDSGLKVWSLINLICMLSTLYILLPILHIKDKFKRKQMMDEINQSKYDLIYDDEASGTEKSRIMAYAQTLVNGEVGGETVEQAVEDLNYQVDRFDKRIKIGTIGEIIITIGSIVLFFLTEDMRLPMVLIDKWTPLMILDRKSVM